MTDWLMGVFALIGVVAAIWSAIACARAANEAEAQWEAGMVYTPYRNPLGGQRW